MTSAAPVPVSRTIALAGGDAATAAQALAGRPGVVAANAEPGGKSVRVEYDLRQTRLAAIELALAETGTPAKRGLAGIWRRALIRFTEDNLLASADIEPHCCCKPPKGA